MTPGSMTAASQVVPANVLRLSSTLRLPLLAATETFAILGRRGSGKTHTAVVLAEQRAWYAGVQAYMVRWVEAHKNGAADTWTSDSRRRAALDENGAWR